MFMVAMVLLAVALYGFYRVEQFLTRDSRFTLSAADDTPTLEIMGPRTPHAVRSRPCSLRTRAGVSI
jgi:hypothetical protein